MFDCAASYYFCSTRYRMPLTPVLTRVLSVNDFLLPRVATVLQCCQAGLRVSNRNAMSRAVAFIWKRSYGCFLGHFIYPVTLVFLQDCMNWRAGPSWGATGFSLPCMLCDPKFFFSYPRARLLKDTYVQWFWYECGG